MQAKSYKHWYQFIADRDNNTCKRCGKYQEGQIAHHIKPKSRYPELRLETDNGVYLCLNCHDWTHRHPKEAHEQGLFYVSKYGGL